MKIHLELSGYHSSLFIGIVATHTPAYIHVKGRARCKCCCCSHLCRPFHGQLRIL